MNEINSASTDAYHLLFCIKNIVNTQPMTWELHDALIDQLNILQKKIFPSDTTITNTNVFVKNFLQEVRQEIISLYGKIEHSLCKHELTLIKTETDFLKKNLQQNDLLQIALITKSLKDHIDRLCHSFTLTLKERRVIILANIEITHAIKIIQKESPSLLPSFVVEKEQCEEVEMLLEELSEYLEYFNKKEFKLLWNRLSFSQKNLIIAYLNVSKELTEDLGYFFQDEEIDDLSFTHH